MTRSGYSDDLDSLELGAWRGQVASAIRGKRGQRFLRDLVAALDAMPDRRLIAGELEDDAGCVCALGALGRHRGLALHELDTYEYEELGRAFGVARQLAQEVMYLNDDCASPERRWEFMRHWAVRNISVTPEEAGAVEVNPK